MLSYTLNVRSEEQTQQLASVFSHYCYSGIIFLQGELGAGKTTFARAFVASAGYSGKVKSPTYTLVEPYQLASRAIYHFDLYRLEDAEELLFLGCDEYFEQAAHGKNGLCLIEWPAKGEGFLPSADIEIKLGYTRDDAEHSARSITINANTRKGEQMLNAMHVELQSLF